MSDRPEERVRVHTFAAMRKVHVNTVWNWIASGKVRAEKDDGGHRWWVYIKKTTTNSHKEHHGTIKTT